MVYKSSYLNSKEPLFIECNFIILLYLTCLVLLSITNLIITIYLLFYVLTIASLIVISIITFIMFLIQIFTSFRVKRTLVNSLMLLLISGGFVIVWQGYMYYQD